MVRKKFCAWRKKCWSKVFVLDSKDAGLDLLDTRFLSSFVKQNLSDACRRDTTSFLKSLIDFELWALKCEVTRKFSSEKFLKFEFSSVRCQCKAAEWYSQWKHQPVWRLWSVFRCAVERWQIQGKTLLGHRSAIFVRQGRSFQWLASAVAVNRTVPQWIWWCEWINLVNF